MNSITSVILFVIGLSSGAALAWALLKSRLRLVEQAAVARFEHERADLTARINSTESRLREMRDERDQANQLMLGLQGDLTEERERRSAAEALNTRIPQLERLIFEKGALNEEQQREITNLKSAEVRLQTELASALDLAAERLASSKKQYEEKLTFLAGAREELTLQFKDIAAEVLDKSTRTFTAQNKTNLDALLGPLATRIKDFEQKVGDTYSNEARERFSLEREVRKLQELNGRISEEAVNLTNALRGQTKTQGTWGELVLQRVLESSGLEEGREYETQVCDTDEEGRRMLPDVIVHLPEDRHLIIDSKVNLKAYERFCTLEPGAERDEELKKHVTAFRRHIDQLSRKEYDQRCQLNSVDYVLMFVPVEPAYTLAVAHDQNVFDEALRKNVVIVTPSTAHAMLRTIALIWRQENQSKNALEIAKKSGALYDKFVGFVQDLEDIGNKLQQTQNSYESAHRKLISGRGNLIRSSEAIRQLGAKNRKRLPGHILAASADDCFIDESAVDSTSGDSVSDGFEIDDSSIPDILEPRRPVGDDPQVTSDSIVCSAASASE